MFFAMALQPSFVTGVSWTNLRPSLRIYCTTYNQTLCSLAASSGRGRDAPHGPH